MRTGIDVRKIREPMADTVLAGTDKAQIWTYLRALDRVSEVLVMTERDSLLQALGVEVATAREKIAEILEKP
jgi:hypothetical protein